MSEYFNKSLRKPKGILVSFWFIYMVLLIQNPFGLYLIFHDVYKALYVGVVLLFGILLSGNKSSRFYFYNNNYLKIYFWFFAITVIFVFVNPLFTGIFKLGLNVQFITRILQFFLIYNLVKILQPIAIINTLHKLAILLCILSIVLAVANYFSIPVPYKAIPYSSGSGEMYYAIPFGFVRHPIPYDPVTYRSYSYFLEPSYFAYFILCFLIYSLVLLYDKIKISRIIEVLIFVIALIFTQSTAAFLVLGLILVFFLINIKKKSLFIGLLSFVLLIIVFYSLYQLGVLLYEMFYSSENKLLFRRAAGFESRLLQWQLAFEQMLQNPYGLGLGNNVAQETYRESLDKIYTYSGPTNLFVSVYYLGFMYALPLLVIVFFYIRWSITIPSDSTKELKAISVIIMATLVYSLSINLLFNAFFQTLLAALIILRKDKQQYVKIFKPNITTNHNY